MTNNFLHFLFFQFFLASFVGQSFGATSSSQPKTPFAQQCELFEQNGKTGWAFFATDKELITQAKNWFQALCRVDNAEARKLQVNLRSKFKAKYLFLSKILHPDRIPPTEKAKEGADAPFKALDKTYKSLFVALENDFAATSFMQGVLKISTTDQTLTQEESTRLLANIYESLSAWSKQLFPPAPVTLDDIEKYFAYDPDDLFYDAKFIDAEVAALALKINPEILDAYAWGLCEAIAGGSQDMLTEAKNRFIEFFDTVLTQNRQALEEAYAKITQTPHSAKVKSDIEKRLTNACEKLKSTVDSIELVEEDLLIRGNPFSQVAINLVKKWAGKHFVSLNEIESRLAAAHGDPKALFGVKPQETCLTQAHLDCYLQLGISAYHAFQQTNAEFKRAWVFVRIINHTFDLLGKAFEENRAPDSFNYHAIKAQLETSYERAKDPFFQMPATPTPAPSFSSPKTEIPPTSTTPKSTPKHPRASTPPFEEPFVFGTHGARTSASSSFQYDQSYRPETNNSLISKSTEKKMVAGILFSIASLCCLEYFTRSSVAMLQEIQYEFSGEKTRKRNVAKKEDYYGTRKVTTTWHADEPIVPIVLFTPEERAAIYSELSLSRWALSTLAPKSSLKFILRMALYKRYAKALHGKKRFSQYGSITNLERGLIYTYDTIQNGCKKISSTFFDNVRTIINEEFMQQVEAKGKELKLSEDEFLTHKLEAATITVEIAREHFSIDITAKKLSPCGNDKQITALEQQLLTEFRTALAQKLAPFMTVA